VVEDVMWSFNVFALRDTWMQIFLSEAAIGV
jgi:hypothetical protein